MNIVPVPGWNVKVNGFRSPAAQMARLAPVVVPAMPAMLVGLSAGIDAVGVDAQDLAVPRAMRLRVGPVGVVADGDVELAVRAEVDRAAVVVRGRRERVEVEDFDLVERAGFAAVSTKL